MKTNRLSLRWLMSALAICWVTSCQRDKEDPTPTVPSGQDLFVSADSITTIAQPQLQALARTAGFGAFAPQLKYAVTFRRFLYKTSYKGQMLEVSGLLALPLNTPAPPALLSAQHGTMFRYADAPSNFPASFSGFELFASTGFVTLIPDYIGLGVSRGVPQPFYDKPTSAGGRATMKKTSLKKE
jgi:hypothetical protein